MHGCSIQITHGSWDCQAFAGWSGICGPVGRHSQGFCLRKRPHITYREVMEKPEHAGCKLSQVVWRSSFSNHQQGGCSRLYQIHGGVSSLLWTPDASCDSGHNDSKNFSSISEVRCPFGEIGFAASGKECNFCKLLGRFGFEHFWKLHQRDIEERHGCHVERGCETALLQGAPWHPWWSMPFLHDTLWSCRSAWWLREVLSRDGSISAFGVFSAEPRQFGYCIGFHWTICCRMVHSNLNSVREAAILVEASEFAAYR